MNFWYKSMLINVRCIYDNIDVVVLYTCSIIYYNVYVHTHTHIRQQKRINKVTIHRFASHYS